MNSSAGVLDWQPVTATMLHNKAHGTFVAQLIVVTVVHRVDVSLPRIHGTGFRLSPQE
jgi:hypothetical protein